MASKAVGEELQSDHLHLTVHVTIPHPESENVPTIVATSARHINNHVVSTGPLFAIACLDMPYPVPTGGFLSLITAVLRAAVEELQVRPENIVWGMAGRKVKESLMPQPQPEVNPLW